MHVFLYCGTFGLMVLQLILASKLSELEHFEKDITIYWTRPLSYCGILSEALKMVEILIGV